MTRPRGPRSPDLGGSGGETRLLGLRLSYGHLALRPWGWWKERVPREVEPVVPERGDVDLLGKGGLE